jgi:opacity protein-like surface antigen
MRKLILLCGAVLCLSFTAAAQDSTPALDSASPTSEAALPASLSPSDRQPWQLGIGYQYQGYRKVLGQNFHNNGFNGDVTRFLNDWIGLEGTAVMGFGNTGAPLHLTAKSVFLGGGAHIAVHNSSRLEPWAHALVGWQHFRFTQTSSLLGSNSALGYMLGGGADFKLSGRLYWRVQGDYIGTHFQSANQSNYSFGSGIVFNF